MVAAGGGALGFSRALTGLLGRSENDPEVRTSRDAIGKKGWAAEILRKQKDGKYWENPESCLVPKFASTVWSKPASLLVSHYYPERMSAMLTHNSDERHFQVLLNSFNTGA